MFISYANVCSVLMLCSNTLKRERDKERGREGYRDRKRESERKTGRERDR